MAPASPETCTHAALIFLLRMADGSTIRYHGFVSPRPLVSSPPLLFRKYPNCQNSTSLCSHHATNPPQAPLLAYDPADSQDELFAGPFGDMMRAMNLYNPLRTRFDISTSLNLPSGMVSTWTHAHACPHMR